MQFTAKGNFLEGDNDAALLESAASLDEYLKEQDQKSSQGKFSKTPHHCHCESDKHTTVLFLKQNTSYSNLHFSQQRQPVQMRHYYSEPMQMFLNEV